MHPLLASLLTLVATLVVIALVLVALSGGNVGRLGLALRCFLRALRDPAFAAKVQPLLAPPEPPKPVKPSGAPLRLLALLQRDGRLLDFLLENIQAYGDEQIGAAVRKIHSDCQATIKEHLVLEPVVPHEEESIVQVERGFDPSAIRLTGNVTGQPPFRGTLKHRGWRVKELKLAPPPEGQDEFVVMPAEVELP
jgi:hypothetical protein